MRTVVTLVMLGALGAGGCSGAPATGAAPPPVAPVVAPPGDAAIAVAADAPIEVAVAVDAEVVADAAPVATPDAPAAPVVEIPAQLRRPPRVKGAAIRIDTDVRKRLGGLWITFGRSGHKHRADDGPALGMYAFTVTKGADAEDLELRSDVPGFQAEVVVHGALLVFEHLSYTRFGVVLAAARAPAELDEEACEARIEAAARRAKLPEGRARSSSTENGILEVRDGAWRASCGRYTRRVWFAPAGD